MKPDNEYRKETIEYIKLTNKNYMKQNGQYFTPKYIRDQLIKKLPTTKKKIKILDPGCGTGEFLLSASKYFKNFELYGWDIDPKLIEITKKIVPGVKTKLINSLTMKLQSQFDIIIGNPPYFEFKPSTEIKDRFKEVINGRTNIFNLFIKLGLDLLKENGYLAYVVPPSMNNGAYFSKLRNYIIKNANIEHLSILTNPKLFHNAQQSVMILVLKKTKNNGNFIFKKNELVIFTEKPNHLNKIFKGKKTLKDLGYKVKTGRLVWNQNKHLLTNNKKGATLLIWSKNITSNGLKIPIDNKPQYVNTSDYDVGPAIVVNRIIGSVGDAHLKATIIPEGFKFLAENHVNVIYPPITKSLNLNLFKDAENYNLNLKQIVSQLNSKEKIEILKYITGNTQISKNELESLLPLDV